MGIDLGTSSRMCGYVVRRADGVGFVSESEWAWRRIEGLRMCCKVLWLTQYGGPEMGMRRVSLSKDCNRSDIARKFFLSVFVFGTVLCLVFSLKVASATRAPRD